jgi:hypothetical protein
MNPKVNPRIDEEIAEAAAGLRDLAAHRQAKQAARAARAREWAEQAAKHVQQPQSRGARRRMLSKP